MKRKNIFVDVMIAMITLCGFLGGCFGDYDSSGSSGFIGDVVTYKDVSIKVTSVIDTKEFDYHSTDDNFIVIYFNVKNNSNETISINPLYCSLRKGTAKYDSCVDYDWDIYDIIPGASKTLYMVYETVQKSTEAIYEMWFGYDLLSIEEIKITLRTK